MWSALFFTRSQYRNMSSLCTPVRNPLREIKAANTTPSSHMVTPQKGILRTPKVSPGPALLLAIKLSAKKEDRHIHPPLPTYHEDKENEEAKSQGDQDVSYFRKLLSDETKRVTALCDKWDKDLTELVSTGDCSDALLGDIRTTVGQGRLIMRERFHQFEGLVDNCEFGTSEKPVTCQDLQGFWDMIYFQVEDVDAKFSKLDKCRIAGWDVAVLKEVTKQEKPVAQAKKKATKKGPTKTSEAAKARRQEFAKKRAEARNRLAAAKAAMKPTADGETLQAPAEKERVTFDAGFFKIDSPVKSPRPAIVTPSGISMKKQLTVQNHVSSPDCKVPKPRSTLTETHLTQSPRSYNTTRTAFCNTAAPTQKLDFEDVGNVENTCEKAVVEIIVENIDEAADNLAESSNHDVGARTPSIPSASKNVTRESLCNSPYVNISLSELAPEPAESEQLVKCRDAATETYSSAEKAKAKMGFPTLENKDIDINIPPPSPFDSTILGDVPVAQEGLGTPVVADSSRIEAADSTRAEKASLCVPVKVVEVENFEDCTGMGIETDDKDDMSASDAANLSIFIANASKNIKQMSDMLCSSVDASTKSPMIRSTVASATVDTGTLVTPTLGGKAKSVMESLLQETLEKMMQQMVTQQQQKTTDETRDESHQSSQKDMIELQERVDMLEKENLALKARVEERTSQDKSLVELLFKSDGQGDPESEACNDVSYKAHYYRILAQTKVLQSELDAYKCIQPDLMKMKEEFLETSNKLDRKAKQLEKYGEKVTKAASVLEAQQQAEHNELMAAESTIAQLNSELATLKGRLENTESTNKTNAAVYGDLVSQHKDALQKLEVSEAMNSKLVRENSSLQNQNGRLEDDISAATKRHSEEEEKVKMLESKLAYMGQELNTAFCQFQAEMEKQETIIAANNVEYDKMIDENSRLHDNVKALQDKVETLEYVEDERQSLQEQLVETENLVQTSSEEISRLNEVVKSHELRQESLRQDLQKKQNEYENLQEELDVAKAEAHLMVLQRQEELVYGNSGVKNMLSMMRDMQSELQKLLKMPDADDGKVSKQLEGEGPAIKETGQATSAIDFKCKEEGNGSSGGDSIDVKKVDEDTLFWKVDRGLELVKSIACTFALLQTQFEKEISDMHFQNSVLEKQLAAMKERVADFNKNENELETFLRSRIAKLTEDRDEKARKLELHARTMRLLSDQNMELTQIKFKYEEMKTARNGRKRRSSSAGSLRFPR